jgi:hypothetical protein
MYILLGGKRSFMLRNVTFMLLGGKRGIILGHATNNFLNSKRGIILGHATNNCLNSKRGIILGHATNNFLNSKRGIIPGNKHIQDFLLKYTFTATYVQFVALVNCTQDLKSNPLLLNCVEERPGADAVIK